MSAHGLHVIYQFVNVSMGLHCFKQPRFCNLLLHNNRSVGNHILGDFITVPKHMLLSCCHYRQIYMYTTAAQLAPSSSRYQQLYGPCCSSLNLSGVAIGEYPL